MVNYSTDMLLNEVGAEHTEANKNVANMIIRVYMTSKNLYAEDMVNLMKEYITTGVINFNKYNLVF